MMLREKLLITLSFFDPMDIELILMELDIDHLGDHRDLTLDDLYDELKSMEKEGLIKTQGEGQGQTWIKIQKKRSWWQRLFV
jgi:DNA-binding PadR family transcriptional regulator